MIEGMVHCAACDTTILPDAVNGKCPNCGEDPLSGATRTGRDGQDSRVRGPSVYRAFKVILASVVLYALGYAGLTAVARWVGAPLAQAAAQADNWTEKREAVEKYLHFRDLSATIVGGIFVVATLLLLIGIIMIARCAVHYMIARGKRIEAHS
jgi:predicted RNA-binding Zn-ribbon protein involved in translation (DUF1610 family)